MVATSRTAGVFSRTRGSGVSSEAAMAGSTAFLAPLTERIPSSRRPPRILIFSIGGESLCPLA